MMVTAPKAAAQVAVEIGVAPDCPYGYYDVAPYDCAPYGYYGSEWFSGGIFIGTGPWFHGSENFRGHVNNRFHPDHGYAGPKPQRGVRSPHRRIVSIRFPTSREMKFVTARPGRRGAKANTKNSHANGPIIGGNLFRVVCRRTALNPNSRLPPISRCPPWALSAPTESVCLHRQSSSARCSAASPPECRVRP